MSSLNRVILIGRVVAPPEMRYTNSGKAVASFRLAVDRRGRSDGENTADFIPIVAWERLAEVCNEFLSKGKLIAIEGRLQTRTYEKDGQKRSAFDVVADEMRMLSSRNEGEGQAAPAQQPQRQTQQRPASQATRQVVQQSASWPDPDDEVPF
jgi:single-strand DNA-binding protein